MFERYNEKARRTIFFARYEASQFGSPYIETEHLLLGLLREDKSLAHRFLRSHAESIREQIERHTAPEEKVATSVDLPLSHECKRGVAYGAEEAERLTHKHIGTEHLLLGLLREEKCFAARLLHEQGLTIDSVREQLQESAPPLARDPLSSNVSTSGLPSVKRAAESGPSGKSVSRTEQPTSPFTQAINRKKTKRARIWLPPKSSRRFRSGSISSLRAWSAPSLIMNSKRRASFRTKNGKSARICARCASSSI
jgi:ATP-dependent Clp protease ATP-binding subunit ClpC